MDKKRIVGLGVFASLFHPFPVFAAIASMESCAPGGVATIKCLEPIFANVVAAVVSLAGVAMFLMFIVGGFTLMLSGGDPKKTEQGKNTLTMAVAGLVLIVAAYLILKLISEYVGFDLTQFSVSVN